LRTEKIFYLLFFLILILLNPVSAKEIVLNENEQEVPLNQFIGVYEDATNKLTITDLLKLPEDSFKYIQNNIPRSDKINTNYWLKFTVKNASNHSLHVLLEAWDFNYDEIEFYNNKQGSYIKQTAGADYNFFNRLFYHKNFEFELSLNEQETKTFYVRLKAERIVGFPFVIRSYRQFIDYALNEYYLLGFFYGILIAIALSNLFLYLLNKEIAYLYYVLYLMSGILYFMIMDGTAFQYLWPRHPELNKNSFAYPLFSLIIWTCMYSKSLLNTSVNVPVLNKVINYTITVRILLFCYSFLFDQDQFYNLKFLDILPLVLVFISGIICLYRGYRPARFYVIAFSVFFTGFIVLTLRTNDIIQTNVFTFYFINLAILVEALILSIALADKVKTLRREKEKALEEMLENKDNLNIQLERKVEERTLELKSANDKLEAQATDLMAANIQLGSQAVELKEANDQLAKQSEEITKINLVLQHHNIKLEDNVKNLSKARVMQKIVTFEEFQEIYPDEESCYKFLENLKWENGYKCIKCGHIKYSKGNSPFSRRCNSCNYIESVTTHTIFNRLRFPIVKAFYMLFLITSKKQITVDELTKLFELRRETCWSFRKKVLEVLEAKKGKRKRVEAWSQLIILEESITKEPLSEE